MPDQHALLSASSAHRWLHCPPSALAVDGVADASSDAALQGTAAHALAEYKLLRFLKRRAKRPTSEWIDEEMEGHTDDYVQFVAQHLASAREHCSDPQVYVEQRLDYSHLAPGGFGTGDCVIVAEPTLQVIDLKYGMGVEVSPVENPQLMLYGLGALAAFDALYDIREVSLSIFQPRRANIETWSISTQDLIAWGENTVKPIADLAARGEGEYAAGPWCQFCRIAPTCRARAESNLVLAKHEFAPPAELSVSEVAEVLAKIPGLLTVWFSRCLVPFLWRGWKANLKRDAWTPAKKEAWSQLVKARWAEAKRTGVKDARKVKTPPEALAHFRAVSAAEAKRLRAEREER